MEPSKPLDAKERKFVSEYLIDLDPRRAALAAGYSATMATTKAYQWVSDGQRKPHVYEAVQRAMGNRGERTGITADRVLQELWDIATADPNELIQFRRGACFDCWPKPVAEELEGQPHGGALKRSKKIDPPSVADPNPDCPSCRGEGSGRAFVFDTREIKGAARKLYAGVKVTKEGAVEVKMHDKIAALMSVGRHLGMFKERVEHTGVDGGPIETLSTMDLTGLSMEQLRALSAIRLDKAEK